MVGTEEIVLKYLEQSLQGLMEDGSEPFSHPGGSTVNPKPIGKGFSTASPLNSSSSSSSASLLYAASGGGGTAASAAQDPLGSWDSFNSGFKPPSTSLFGRGPFEADPSSRSTASASTNEHFRASTTTSPPGFGLGLDLGLGLGRNQGIQAGASDTQARLAPTGPQAAVGVQKKDDSVTGLKNLLLATETPATGTNGSIASEENDDEWQTYYRLRYGAMEAADAQPVGNLSLSALTQPSQPQAVSAAPVPQGNGVATTIRPRPRPALLTPAALGHQPQPQQLHIPAVSQPYRPPQVAITTRPPATSTYVPQLAQQSPLQGSYTLPSPAPGAVRPTQSQPQPQPPAQTRAQLLQKAQQLAQTLNAPLNPALQGQPYTPPFTVPGTTTPLPPPSLFVYPQLVSPVVQPTAQSVPPLVLQANNVQTPIPAITPIYSPAGIVPPTVRPVLETVLSQPIPQLVSQPVSQPVTRPVVPQPPVQSQTTVKSQSPPGAKGEKKEEKQVAEEKKEKEKETQPKEPKTEPKPAAPTKEHVDKAKPQLVAAPSPAESKPPKQESTKVEADDEWQTVKSARSYITPAASAVLAASTPVAPQKASAAPSSASASAASAPSSTVRPKPVARESAPVESKPNKNWPKPTAKRSEKASPEALKPFNQRNYPLNPSYARYFVIKSYSEEDIHKSIKYSIWASTDQGNRRLDTAFVEAEKKGPIFLFFSYNGSGHFQGMAQMMSRLDFDTSSDVWAESKWKGHFKVQWLVVKDLPNGIFRHITLANNEGKPVTNSRDTQEVPMEQGKEVVRIFTNYPYYSSILDDFQMYDEQEAIAKKKNDSH